MTGSAADVLDFQLHVAKINGANVFAIHALREVELVERFGRGARI